MSGTEGATCAGTGDREGGGYESVEGVGPSRMHVGWSVGDTVQGEARSDSQGGGNSGENGRGRWKCEICLGLNPGFLNLQKQTFSQRCLHS